MFGSTYGMYSIEINNTHISNSWILVTRCGFHVCSDMKGIRESEEVEHGKLKLIMGIGVLRLLTRLGVMSSYLR